MEPSVSVKKKELLEDGMINLQTHISNQKLQIMFIKYLPTSSSQ